MNFEDWAKSKGHPFHDLEPTFNGSKDRYSVWPGQWVQLNCAMVNLV